MKSWTVRELNNVVATLAPLRGLRLQEVMTSPQDVVLGFYSASGLLWLWIDLAALNPSVLPWTQLPFKPQAVKSPLQLFLRAHFLARVLTDIEVSASFGRVVYLTFGEGDDRPRLELRLFPHGRNLLATAAGKKIAWQKPAELSEAGDPVGRISERDLDQLREEWRQARAAGKMQRATAAADPRAKLQNNIDKKLKAVEKVREELQRKQDLPWRQIGDWIKAHQSLDVPSEWEPFVDRRRKLAWNIEQCYTKAREGEGKLGGTERRLAALEREIADLRLQLQGPLNGAAPAAKTQPTLADIKAEGRTLRLPGDLTVVAGKSAADNMKILRKARSWDLWFHLRDYPGSHAVLFRNKNVKINDATLHQVAEWFIRLQLGVKAKAQVGEKFDVAVTECRYVRPIKGDKLGRVSYHDERVLTCRLN